MYILVAIIIALCVVVVILTLQLKSQRNMLSDQLRATRKQRDDAKSSLEEIQSDSQVTLDALSDALFIVSTNLEIHKTNARAREIFRNQTLIGRNLPEIFMKSTLTDTVRRMVEHGTPAEEKIILSASGHTLSGEVAEGESAWIVQVTPLPNHVNNPLTCIVLRDISTEHQTEQIRTDFVANASHELRTPLAIINGYLENLLDDDVVESPSMSRKMLGTMRKHGSRLSRLIDDMLVVSKLESGENAALNHEPFNLIECIEDVLERLDQIVTASGTQIIKSFEQDKIIMVGDRFYWTQVLFNLIENAIKQNPNRSLKVTITVKLTENGIIDLSISDNGIGIPSSHLPFIFKRFYRVDKHHTQSDIKGTGLGLSIVKRAIEAHSGTIEATSSPGIETRFNIRVPIGSTKEDATHSK